MNKKNDLVRFFFHALGLSCTVAPLLWLLFSLSEIQEKVPIHYNVAGEVNYGSGGVHLVTLGSLFVGFLSLYWAESQRRNELLRNPSSSHPRTNLAFIPVMRFFLPCISLFIFYDIYTSNYSQKLFFFFIGIFTFIFLVSWLVLFPSSFSDHATPSKK